MWEEWDGANRQWIRQSLTPPPLPPPPLLPCLEVACGVPRCRRHLGHPRAGAGLQQGGSVAPLAGPAVARLPRVRRWRCGFGPGRQHPRPLPRSHQGGLLRCLRCAAAAGKKELVIIHPTKEEKMDSGNRRSTIHATGRTALRPSENTPPLFALLRAPRPESLEISQLGPAASSFPRPIHHQGFCVQNLLQRISDDRRAEERASLYDGRCPRRRL